MEPQLTNMADEFVGKAAFAKVDIEQSKDLAQKYHVAAIPTTLIFKDGEETGRVVGASVDQVRDKLNDAL